MRYLDRSRRCDARLFGVRRGRRFSCLQLYGAAGADRGKPLRLPQHAGFRRFRRRGPLLLCRLGMAGQPAASGDRRWGSNGTGISMTISAVRLSFGLAAAMSVPILAGAETAPYAGQQSREIKALSPAEIVDLEAGRGMGMAK